MRLSRTLVCAALTGAIALFADTAADVRALLANGDFGRAEALVRDDIARRGPAPDALEAMSWIARAYLMTNNLPAADKYAMETYRLCASARPRTDVNAEHSWELAMGAALEVRSEVLSASGKKAQAVALLRRELARYHDTELGTRIQKNLNTIELVGRPAPPLATADYLGSKRPPSLASLRGRPVLLFFWADWCPDCKADAPVIVRIRRDFPKLALIGPTQLYGYANGEEATPQQERGFMDAVLHRFYTDLLDMPVPISAANLKAYGASTTPTLVLLDRAGIVRMYHPGAMTYEDLAAAIRALPSSR